MYVRVEQLIPDGGRAEHRCQLDEHRTDSGGGAHGGRVGGRSGSIAILAIVSYFIIRGAFCPANSNVQQINIYGFAGLAALVGIASEPIALKLKQVANTLFTKPIQGKDSNPQE